MYIIGNTGMYNIMYVRIATSIASVLQRDCEKNSVPAYYILGLQVYPSDRIQYLTLASFMSKSMYMIIWSQWASKGLIYTGLQYIRCNTPQLASISIQLHKLYYIIIII